MATKYNTRDLLIISCETYEDYLESFITNKELGFTRNVKICRELVARCKAAEHEIYSAKEFEKQKEVMTEAIFPKKNLALLYSAGVNIDDPVLRELANREESNMKKIISTVIFVMHINARGFEISSYIDYDYNLRIAHARYKNCRDWKAIFRGEVQLLPKMSDLNYLDWHRKISYSTDTDNYKVIRDVKHGLIFRHKGDLKNLNVNAESKSDENFTRSVYFSEKFGYVVLYDHLLRKKN